MQGNEQAPSNEALEDITGVTCIYVPVSRVYDAVQWYTKNLGCVPTDHNPVVPEMSRAILRFPDSSGSIEQAGLRSPVPALMLMTAKRSAGSLGFRSDNGDRQPVLCFTTPRVQEMHERFRGNGVTITTDSRESVPGGPYLEFSDPDGNLFAIWQP